MGGWFSGPRQQEAPVQQAQPETIAPEVEAAGPTPKKKKKVQGTQTNYAGGMLGSSEIANINNNTLLGQ